MVEIMDMENMGQNSVDSVIGIGDQWVQDCGTYCMSLGTLVCLMLWCMLIIWTIHLNKYNN